jgi:hypothetical protein
VENMALTPQAAITNRRARFPMEEKKAVKEGHFQKGRPNTVLTTAGKVHGVRDGIIPVYA